MPTEPTRPNRLVNGVFSVARFIEEDIPSILLAISVLLLCTDVVARYAFNSPIPGAGQIAMICFIWVTYISAGAIARRGRHIVIDVLVVRFPLRLQAVLQFLVQLLVLALIAYVLLHTVDALMNARFVSIPGLGISRRVFTVAVLVGFVLMALYAVRDLVVAVRGAITGDYAPVVDVSDDEFDSLEANAPIGSVLEPPTSVTEAVFIKDLAEDISAGTGTDTGADGDKEPRS